MKISLWPSNIIEFIKVMGIYWIPVFIGFAVIGLIITAVVVDDIHSRHIHAKYPIGKHVAIKGTGLEGTISKVNGCGCDIEVMIVHKDGTIERVTVDHQMIDL